MPVTRRREEPRTTKPPTGGCSRLDLENARSRAARPHTPDRRVPLAVRASKPATTMAKATKGARDCQRVPALSAGVLRLRLGVRESHAPPHPSAAQAGNVWRSGQMRPGHHMIRSGAENRLTILRPVVPGPIRFLKDEKTIGPQESQRSGASADSATRARTQTGRTSPRRRASAAHPVVTCAPARRHPADPGRWRPPGAPPPPSPAGPDSGRDPRR